MRLRRWVVPVLAWTFAIAAALNACRADERFHKTAFSMILARNATIDSLREELRACSIAMRDSGCDVSEAIPFKHWTVRRAALAAVDSVTTFQDTVVTYGWKR